MYRRFQDLLLDRMCKVDYQSQNNSLLYTVLVYMYLSMNHIVSLFDRLVFLLRHMWHYLVDRFGKELCQN